MRVKAILTMKQQVVKMMHSLVIRANQYYIKSNTYAGNSKNHERLWCPGHFKMYLTSMKDYISDSD